MLALHKCSCQQGTICALRSVASVARSEYAKCICQDRRGQAARAWPLTPGLRPWQDALQQTRIATPSRPSPNNCLTELRPGAGAGATRRWSETGRSTAAEGPCQGRQRACSAAASRHRRVLLYRTSAPASGSRISGRHNQRGEPTSVAHGIRASECVCQAAPAARTNAGRRKSKGAKWHGNRTKRSRR